MLLWRRRAIGICYTMWGSVKFRNMRQQTRYVECAWGLRALQSYHERARVWNVVLDLIELCIDTLVLVLRTPWEHVAVACVVDAWVAHRQFHPVVLGDIGAREMRSSTVQFAFHPAHCRHSAAHHIALIQVLGTPFIHAHAAGRRGAQVAEVRLEIVPRMHARVVHTRAHRLVRIPFGEACADQRRKEENQNEATAHWRHDHWRVLQRRGTFPCAQACCDYHVKSVIGWLATLVPFHGESGFEQIEVHPNRRLYSFWLLRRNTAVETLQKQMLVCHVSYDTLSSKVVQSLILWRYASASAEDRSITQPERAERALCFKNTQFRLSLLYYTALPHYHMSWKVSIILAHPAQPISYKPSFLLVFVVHSACITTNLYVDLAVALSFRNCARKFKAPYTAVNLARKVSSLDAKWRALSRAQCLHISVIFAQASTAKTMETWHFLQYLHGQLFYDSLEILRRPWSIS